MDSYDNAIAAGILTLGALILGADAVLLLMFGAESTFSHVITRWHAKRPAIGIIVALIAGLLIGHWFL